MYECSEALDTSQNLHNDRLCFDYASAYPRVHQACYRGDNICNYSRRISVPCCRGIGVQGCPQNSGTIVDLDCESKS